MLRSLSIQMDRSSSLQEVRRSARSFGISWEFSNGPLHPTMVHVLFTRAELRSVTHDVHLA
ncbi:hypothetical protein LINGRAHAP2_LOCUS9804 [Linum grandiflorum]